MAGKSYSRFDNRLRVRLNGQWCVYCGEWATQDEHFPPATYSRNGVILPVCRECNGLAGTTWATDFIERVAHVREKLRHKYRNVLESPEWAQWELSELSYSLRQKVQKWQELRKFILKRLAWDAATYLSLIDRGQDFAQAVAGMSTIIASEKAKLRSQTALSQTPANNETPTSTWKQTAWTF
jgi:hypothetical protein